MLSVCERRPTLLPSPLRSTTDQDTGSRLSAADLPGGLVSGVEILCGVTDPKTRESSHYFAQSLRDAVHLSQAITYEEKCLWRRLSLKRPDEVLEDDFFLNIRERLARDYSKTGHTTSSLERRYPLDYQRIAEIRHELFIELLGKCGDLDFEEAAVIGTKALKNDSELVEALGKENDVLIDCRQNTGTALKTLHRHQEAQWFFQDDIRILEAVDADTMKPRSLKAALEDAKIYIQKLKLDATKQGKIETNCPDYAMTEEKGADLSEAGVAPIEEVQCDGATIKQKCLKFIYVQTEPHRNRQTAMGKGRHVQRGGQKCLGCSQTSILPAVREIKGCPVCQPTSWLPDFETVPGALEVRTKAIRRSHSISVVKPINPGTPQTGAPNRPASAADIESASHYPDKFFIELENKNHKLLDRYRDSAEGINKKRVRITAFDTGIACFPRETEPPDIRRLNLENGLPQREDEDGHGTHCARILLKVCPYADTHVYRDSRGGRSTIMSELAAAALRHAVDKSKVDIISILFGWVEDNSAELRAGLEHAKQQKRC
ncbi:hypothetical protein B0J12DRAFT_776579 [Macrophomina phaseolina]|uniref:Peptidase S8/S53 domain-containing protein n=1 Tax=Macrophomina phaseolina TaxID=35725 RepID=A0ABQ8GHB2_9PEZI|nr:hypothetical protein B0J12DRAFT_776579 [Macrophomina phaseolina]